MNKKAQGTIEYLVILAIIVVIALVVVTILSQFTGQGTAIRKQSADSAWKSAQPIAILESQKSSAGVGPVTLRIKNTSAGAITITDFYLVASGAGDQNGVDMNLSAGQEYTVYFAGVTACTAGTAYTYPKAGISITYSTAAITGNKQSIPDDLIISCS